MKRIKNQAIGTTSMVVFLLAGLVAGLGAATAKPNPYLKPNESWISISGTVVNPTKTQFTLDYGKGVITVDMGPWSWYNNDPQAFDGDKVTVYGRVNKHTLAQAEIQASSIYDQNMGTYYYGPLSENNVASENFWLAPGPIVAGRTTVRGTVTNINGRKFTIDTGPRMITVNTKEMPFNPLDNKGFLQIDVGDYVSATGTLNWKKRILSASTLVVLQGS